MMAANPLTAWKRITEGLIQESWAIYDTEDGAEAIDEDNRIESHDLLTAVEFYESIVTMDQG
jgi:hypothetical protein